MSATNRALYNGSATNHGRGLYSPDTGRALWAGTTHATRTRDITYVDSNRQATGGDGIGIWFAPWTTEAWITLRITNNGNSTLVISSITRPATREYVGGVWQDSALLWNLDWSSGSILAGAYQDVTWSVTLGSPPPNRLAYGDETITDNSTSRSGGMRLYIHGNYV